MRNKKGQLVWPRDIYDTIEAEAEASGGISAGEIFDYQRERGIEYGRFGREDIVGPCCLWGHIQTSGVADAYGMTLSGVKNAAIARGARELERVALAQGSTRTPAVTISLIKSIGIAGMDADCIVRSVVLRTTGGYMWKRITFAEFAAEAGIVRGDR